MKSSHVTLANKITILRILLIPAIVITLLHHQNVWVVGLLTFCVLTDFLDGLVARMRGERTKLGAVLDPLADKLLMSAVYITLVFLGILETWIFVIIFSRDLLIILGWGVIYILTGSSLINPRLLGKITTGLQMTTAISCLIPTPDLLHKVILWGTIGITVASAIDYVLIGEKKLGQWG